MKNGYRKTGMGVVAAWFLATALAGADQPMPSDYELARWAFNEGSGTNTADLSGHAWTVTMLQHNGNGNVPTAIPLWTNDAPSGTGYALALNGTDQYASPEPFVGAGNVLWTLSTLTNWSLSMWLKIQMAPGQSGTILGHWDGWGNVGWTLNDDKWIDYGTDNFNFAGVVEGTPHGRQGVQVLGPAHNPDTGQHFNLTGVWHHVVITWRQDAATTNTIAKYYLDGVASTNLRTFTQHSVYWTNWTWTAYVENGPLPTGTFDSDTWHELYLGAEGRNDIQYRAGFFQGLMDEVRIFQGVLDSNRVNLLYRFPEIPGKQVEAATPPSGTVLIVTQRI